MAAIIVIVLFFTVPLLTRVHQAGTLHVGSGTAIVNWTSADTAGGTGTTASFSGSVDGLTLAGTATPESGGSGSQQSAGPGTTWKGTLGASPFVLAVSSGAGGTVTVTGTWGGQRVALTIAGQSAGATGSRLHGTVGQHTVTGSLTHPVQSGHYGRVTAAFDVTT